MLGLWLPCEGRMELLWVSLGTGAPESKVPFKNAINQTTIKKKKSTISASPVFHSLVNQAELVCRADTDYMERNVQSWE